MDNLGNYQTHILLMNRSLFTGLPFFPPANLGVSVHISFTFSNTMLQCRSKALTRANSLRLLRHEIKTWFAFRTAVCRMESGPLVNSYCSSAVTSYSLKDWLASIWKGSEGYGGKGLLKEQSNSKQRQRYSREVIAGLCEKFSETC